MECDKGTVLPTHDKGTVLPTQTHGDGSPVSYSTFSNSRSSAHRATIKTYYILNMGGIQEKTIAAYINI